MYVKVVVIEKNQERFLAFFEAYDVGDPPDTFSCTFCAEVTIMQKYKIDIVNAEKEDLLSDR